VFAVADTLTAKVSNVKKTIVSNRLVGMGENAVKGCFA